MEISNVEKHAEETAIADVVHSEKWNVGEALLPYNAQILENHIRVEDSYTIGERCKTRTFEGGVEDVLKVLAFFKEGKSNDTSIRANQAQ